MTENDEASPTDPITLAIMQHALTSAADQMALSLYRTAYSTIVRDCLDFSTSLCDAQGQMIAQGITLPHHVAAVPFAMRALLNKFGEDIEPGDVFILNDPFDGGMHIPDIFVIRPVFWENRRVAFAVSTAHHADLGGAYPAAPPATTRRSSRKGCASPGSNFIGEASRTRPSLP